MFIPIIEFGLEFFWTKSWILPEDSLIVFYRINGFFNIFFLPFLAETGLIIVLSFSVLGLT